MRTSLSTLLTLGRMLVRVKDRTGAYKLPSGNAFPKFGPAGRRRVVLPSAVRDPKPGAPPNLFAETASPPCEPDQLETSSPRPFPPPVCEGEGEGGGTTGGTTVPDADFDLGNTLPSPLLPMNVKEGELDGKSVADGVAARQEPSPTDGGDLGRDDLLVVRAKVADKQQLVPTDDGEQATILARGGAKWSAVMASVRGLTGRLWGGVAALLSLARLSALMPRMFKFGLRSKRVDARPRAQAELALEKVTVVRNDLSEADLVVVTAERKATPLVAPVAPTAAKAAEGQAARNPWKPVAARWVELNTPEGAAARLGEIAETQP